MEPIPETVESEPTCPGGLTLGRTLQRVTHDVRRIVPEVVGVSLSVIHDDLTFTLTATDEPAAQLDGMQYLGGGPCDETLWTGESHVFEAGDPDDEVRWWLFAQATAAGGIASTLSVPILEDGGVVAGMNLYASSADAFTRHHHELEQACGHWPADVVPETELDVTARIEAAKAPARLRRGTLINQAVGILTSRWWISTDEACRRIEEAAGRAGISTAQMARAVIGLVGRDPDEDTPQELAG